MPEVFSFPGLIGQTRWWQPAKSHALRIHEMESSHRDHTYKYLLRTSESILTATRRHALWMSELGVEIPLPPYLADPVESAEWLDDQPLLAVLQYGPSTPTYSNSSLQLRMDLVFVNEDSFPIANNPFLLLDFGPFTLARRLTSQGFRWRMGGAQYDLFPGSEVSNRLSDLGFADALGGEILASRLESLLSNLIKPGEDLLVQWVRDLPDTSRLHRSDMKRLGKVWALASELESAWTLELDGLDWECNDNLARA